MSLKIDNQIEAAIERHAGMDWPCQCDREIEQLIAAVQRSERLSAEDYAVTINAVHTV